MIQFALKLFIKLIIHFSPKELCASSICQYMGNDASMPGASFTSTAASVVTDGAADAACFVPRLYQILYISCFREALWTIYFFCHFVVNAKLILWEAIHPSVVTILHAYFLYDAGQITEDKWYSTRTWLSKCSYQGIHKRKQLVMLRVFHLTWFIMPHLHSGFSQS